MKKLLKKGAGGSLHEFFFLTHFVDGRDGLSMDALGDMLIGLDHVREVFLDSAQCGYMVRVRFTKEKSASAARDYLAEGVGEREGKLLVYKR